MFRYLVCMFMLIVCLPSCSSFSSMNHNNSPDVYLLLGQSNMAGRAELTKVELVPMNNCLLLNKAGYFQTAQNPLNQFSSIRKNIKMQKLGPGYSFCQSMIAHNIEQKIALVVNAKGGSSINEWQKGTHFYQQALMRAKQALRMGNLKGILWHQGESDTKSPNGYLKKLTQFIQDFRDDLQQPNVPVVLGEIYQNEVINKQIRQIPSMLKNTRVVSAENLTTKDGLHFAHDSVIELGKRYANAMLKLQE